MLKKVILLSLLQFALIHSMTSQISLSALKGAGIKSESDLKRLGVSNSEIDKIKKEYFGAKADQSSGDKNKGENKVKGFDKEPVKTETPIKLVSEKEEEEKGIYGHSIFRNGSVSIQKNSDRIKAKSSYILGTGDRINVSIWGFSEFSDVFDIDDLGYISPKLVGKINLKGKSFKKAKQIIKSRFANVYDLKNSQISIELSYSKVISVNVVGEVKKPGTYSIPSINSAFNILSLTGGPTKIGSVRNIEIVRNGKGIATLDVYHFMESSSNKSSVFLMDGDFIVVHPIQNVVTVSEGVKRPGLYEMKKKETISDLLRFSGGLTAKANTESLSLYRTGPVGKVLTTYNIKDQSNIVLKDGDNISLFELSQHVYNQVSIRGEINSPGVYEYKKGDKISSIIKKANGVNDHSFLELAHLYRQNDNLTKTIIPIEISKILKNNNGPEDIEIKQYDEILIFNKNSFVDSLFVKVTGYVRNNGDYYHREGMTVKDLVLLTGGLLLEADSSRIEIERINYRKRKDESVNYVDIITINMEEAGEFKVEPFDIINFRMLPEFKYQELIQIEGEVKYPGFYSLTGDGVRVSNILNRAGGPTVLSFLERSYIERIEDSLGVILLDLNKVIKDEKSTYNYRLRPGDKIVVPKVNDIISISGAIGSKFIDMEPKINVAYHKGKRASYYVKKFAGGYGKDANKFSVYVITHNGQVKESKLYGLIKPKVNMGDKVVVNYKQPKKENPNSVKINWNSAIENITIKLTGLATLYVLMSNIQTN